MDKKIVILFLTLIIITPGVLFSKQKSRKRNYYYFYKRDLATDILMTNSKHVGYLVLKSVVFLPIAPWFQYTFDRRPTRTQYKKFYSISSKFSYVLTKANNHYSGYEINASMYKNYLGLDVRYDNLSNTNFFYDTYNLNLVFRLRTRRHIQPMLMLGWIYMDNPKFAGGGWNFSFFNYKIMFNKDFHMKVENFIGRIKKHNIIQGVVSFDYFVHPTIKLKAVADIKYFDDQIMHGFKLGIGVDV